MTFNTKKIKITTKSDINDVDFDKIFEGLDKTFENFDKTVNNAFKGFDDAFKNFDKVFDNVDIKIKTRTEKPKRPKPSACRRSPELWGKSKILHKRPEWPKGPERWEESDIPKPPKPPPIRKIREPSLGEYFKLDLWWGLIESVIRFVKFVTKKIKNGVAYAIDGAFREK